MQPENILKGRMGESLVEELLKKSAKEKIVFMDNLRKKLEYKSIK